MPAAMLHNENITNAADEKAEKLSSRSGRFCRLRKETLNMMNMVTPKLRRVTGRECRRLAKTAGLSGCVQHSRLSSTRCIFTSFSPASSMATTRKSPPPRESNTAKGIRAEHIVRTASEPRSGGMFEAVITDMSDLSPTVKGFTFEVDG